MQHGHKQLLRKEKHKYNKEFYDKFRSLKTSNPGAYWKIINQKNNTNVGDITQGMLFDNFSELTKSKSNSNYNSNIITSESQSEIPNEVINIPFSLDEEKKLH